MPASTFLQARCTALYNISCSSVCVCVTRQVATVRDPVAAAAATAVAVPPPPNHHHHKVAVDITTVQAGPPPQQPAFQAAAQC